MAGGIGAWNRDVLVNGNDGNNHDTMLHEAALQCTAAKNSEIQPCSPKFNFQNALFGAFSRKCVIFKKLHLLWVSLWIHSSPSTASDILTRCFTRLFWGAVWPENQKSNPRTRSSTFAPKRPLSGPFSQNNAWLWKHYAWSQGSGYIHSTPTPCIHSACLRSGNERFVTVRYVQPVVESRSASGKMDFFSGFYFWTENVFCQAFSLAAFWRVFASLIKQNWEVFVRLIKQVQNWTQRRNSAECCVAFCTESVVFSSC